jgi:RNA recognition motif-containing protein
LKGKQGVAGKERSAKSVEREKEAEERTVFVRNIGWDSTEDDFKEHME